jgi:hypothetical protein
VNLTREFVRLFEFEKKCKEIGLGEDDIRKIEEFILDNPKSGVVVQGTGGIRKLRYALSNKGKSGGARVIYVDFDRYEKTYLITAYSKGVNENLNEAERNDIKSLVELLEKEAGARKGKVRV